MALTGAQKATLQEIVGLTESTELDYLLLGVNSYQETRIAADIATWDGIKDSHVKLKGGQDGVDFDNERERAAIVQRLKTHLRMSTAGGMTMLSRA